METVQLKWRGQEYQIEKPTPGRTLHEAVSRQFNIPRSRLKLILKGKAFDDISSDDLVREQLRTGLPVMVLGTASGRQLDSTRNRARLLRHDLAISLRALPGTLSGLLLAALNVCWLFVSSLFVPSRRQAPREANRDE